MFITNVQVLASYMFSLLPLLQHINTRVFIRFMKHELRTLQVVCPERDYGNVCPACPVVGEKLSSHCKLI